MRPNLLFFASFVVATPDSLDEAIEAEVSDEDESIDELELSERTAAPPQPLREVTPSNIPATSKLH